MKEQRERDGKAREHSCVRWKNRRGVSGGLGTWQSLSISGSLRPGKAVDI